MIGYISGTVLHKEERSLLVLVGGIGYVVAVTPQILLAIKDGEEVALFTHLAVKEDALDLYGFAHREELALFRALISISGIGPKGALNVLALADVTTLASAIASGESTYLTKVSGIGKKLAEKIVLELKDKVHNIVPTDDTLPHAEGEALDALEALGYAPRDTREIVRSLSKEYTRSQDIIRKALQTLGGR